MSEKKETMDCVMPFIRNPVKVRFEVPTTKFSYELEVTSSRVTRRPGTEAEKTVTTTEATMETREKKVYLKIYSMTEQEDCEHFFEAFEDLQTALSAVWNEAIKAKDRDATILFNAMEKLLGGTARTAWHDVLKSAKDDRGNLLTGRTWEDFKIVTATFITKKVCPNDAYTRQRTYLQERRMPDGMDVHDYWTRLQTFNRRQPMLIGSMNELKRWKPNADFKAWWKDGGLEDQELRSIVLHRVPQVWQRDLERTDIGHRMRNTADIEDLIEHYATLQRLERRGIERARRSGRSGRFTGRAPSSIQARTNTAPQNYYQMSAPRGFGGQGRAWPNYNYNYAPRMRNTQFMANRSGNWRGGRVPATQTGGRFAPRGQGQPGNSGMQRPSTQPGRGQRSRNNPSEAYFQEPTDVEVEEQGWEETGLDQDQFHADQAQSFEEDALIEQWNDAFFDDGFAEVRNEEGWHGWQQSQDAWDSHWTGQGDWDHGGRRRRRRR